MAHERTRVTDGIDAPDRTRPSQLVPPKFAQRRLRADMGDGEARYHDIAAMSAQRRPHRVIVRETVDERLEAADRRQRLAPERQCRAEARMRQAEPKGDRDTRQELRVGDERCQPCPDAVEANAVVEAGHGTDAWLFQRGDHAAKVAAIDPNIAIGEDDDLVADARRHVDEVRDLAIQPVRFVVDDNIEMAILLKLAQALDDGDRAVARMLDAADDLNLARIILRAERAEVLQQTRLAAVQRLENGDCRCGGGTGVDAIARDAAQENRGRDQISAADAGDRRRRDRTPEQDHAVAQWLRDRGSTPSRTGCSR